MAVILVLLSVTDQYVQMATFFMNFMLGKMYEFLSTLVLIMAQVFMM